MESLDNICVFDKGKQCSILTRKECVNCSFFKTEEEYKRHKEKADERFNRLSFDRRKEYGDKYRIKLAEYRPEQNGHKEVATATPLTSSRPEQDGHKEEIENG